MLFPGENDLPWSLVHAPVASACTTWFVHRGFDVDPEGWLRIQVSPVGPFADLPVGALMSATEANEHAAHSWAARGRSCSLSLEAVCSRTAANFRRRTRNQWLSRLPF